MAKKTHRVKEYNIAYDEFFNGLNTGWIYCTNFISKGYAKIIARKNHKNSGFKYGIKNCKNEQ